jgi:hypothetical protein
MNRLHILLVLPVLLLAGCGEADRSGETRQVDTAASKAAAEAAIPKPPPGQAPAIPADVQGKMPAVAPGVGTK